MPVLLQPWWLIALGVIPLIRWWHQRQSPLSTRDVSAVFLWQDELADDTAGREQRPPDPAWRRRALIAGLLIVALAGPAIERDQTTLTVWIDDSLSMQTIENGETRQAASLKLLENELQESGHTNVTRRSLLQTSPTQLDESSTHWLLTDGASERVQDWARLAGIDRVIQTGTLTENVAVSRLSARRNIDDDSVLDVLVSVSNTGNEHNERQLELTVGDQPLQAKNVSLAPGETVHWQLRIPTVDRAIEATVNSSDALVEDDRLTIAADMLRPLATTIAGDCGQALRSAIAAHPALIIVEEDAAVGLEVTCPRGSFPAIEPSARSIGHIRALVGAVSVEATPGRDSTPVWLPFKTLTGNLHLPTEYLSAFRWPAPVDTQQHHVLLRSSNGPLVTVTPSANGQTTTVDTVIDLSHSEFALQPEFAALVATLIDAATGRRLLDGVMSESHDISESIIRPTLIDTASNRPLDNRHSAMQSMTTLFLLTAVLVLILDVVLLVRSRWHEPNLAIALRVAVVLILLAAMWERPSAVMLEARPTGIEQPPAATLAISTASHTARAGERIGVVVGTAMHPDAADVVLIANGQRVARSALSPSGSTVFEVNVPANGPLILGAELRDRGDDAVLAEIEEAALINVASTTSVLVVSNTPSTFAESLRNGGWPVTELRPASSFGRIDALGASSMLVLDDISADDLAAETWAEIEYAVRHEAMGLLVLGGPHSFSLGGYRESPLETVLPVISEPPGNEPPANLIFLIDVSGSMDQPTTAGNRLEIARQAVIDTARALRPIDRVGLMTFDISTKENLPLATRTDHATAVDQSWPDAASGGTHFVPAILSAIDKLEQNGDEQDIIVVLTDGYVSDDDLEQLSSALRATQVEVIALVIAPSEGAVSSRENIDRFIETIRANNGRAIRIEDVLHLPTLMRNEVEQSRPAVVTGPSELAVSTAAPWMPIAGWPTIDQYLLTRPREEAVVNLVSDQGDVIVASMAVGAGKVVVVTSGFAGWTARWLQSEGWPELAAGLTRHLAARDVGPFDIAVVPDTALLTVDLADRLTTGEVKATVVSPSATVTTVKLEPHNPRQLAAELDLDEVGQYLIVVEGETASMRYRFLKSPALPHESNETSTDSSSTSELNWQLWLAGIALLGFLGLLVRERW